jgi:glutathione S-transferase
MFVEIPMPVLKLTLVSHDLCPYVQRAVIALTEKGVPFDRIFIDLADKPDWFLAISPLGKVPLLKVGDDVIFESAVILEYLEETQENPLYPADPLARAKHRAMIEFGSAILSDIWGLEIAPTREVAVAKIEASRQKFARLERDLGAGPWFAGEKFGLVDAVFGPVLRYFDLFDRILDHGIFAATPKVNAWRAALAARPSVRAAVVPDYLERLECFIAKQNGYLAGLLARQAA